MVEAEYKKDLRHNYMVIVDEPSRNAEKYCIKLIQEQEIEGMLPVELRNIDNKALFYYEITSKQSMANILGKTHLTRDKLKKLCVHIIHTVERAYEYLLPEDDFILAPEYIYLDIHTMEPGICFIPGFGKCIRDQMGSLLEYLMNKVDYNDKEAVVLVYQLYAVSKEEGYTFGHLLEVLQNKEDGQHSVENRAGAGEDKPQPENNSMKLLSDFAEGPDTSHAATAGRESKSETPDAEIPVMLEKIEGEAEISCYPLKTYLYAGTCVLGGILIIVLCFVTGILFNSFGNRIDYSKLFALALIIFCGEGYLLNKVLDKKNRITKMVKTREYVDPRQEFGPQKESFARKIIKTTGDNIINPDKSTGHSEAVETAVKEQSNLNIKPVKPLTVKPLDNMKPLNNIQPLSNIKSLNVKPSDAEMLKSGLSDEITSEEEDYNPTCLLNAPPAGKAGLILKALDEANYRDIPITDFPFFIGKFKKNVDFCLENNVVSRYHAKITKEGDVYHITDLNSTNGTFLNGESLRTYQKEEIRFGDEIAFANIKYRFIQLIQQ